MSKLLPYSNVTSVYHVLHILTSLIILYAYHIFIHIYISKNVVALGIPKPNNLVLPSICFFKHKTMIQILLYDNIYAYKFVVILILSTELPSLFNFADIFCGVLYVLIGECTTVVDSCSVL